MPDGEREFSTVGDLHRGGISDGICSYPFLVEKIGRFVIPDR